MRDEIFSGLCGRVRGRAVAQTFPKASLPDGAQDRGWAWSGFPEPLVVLFQKLAIGLSFFGPEFLAAGTNNCQLQSATLPDKDARRIAQRLLAQELLRAYHARP